METTQGSCEAVQSVFLLGYCPGSRFVSGFVWWVRVPRFVSGFASGSRPGSCPVRVGLVSVLVSDSCLGSRGVRVWCVSGSCPDSCPSSFLVRVRARVRVRVRFVSG